MDAMYNDYNVISFERFLFRRNASRKVPPPPGDTRFSAYIYRYRVVKRD